MSKRFAALTLATIMLVLTGCSTLKKQTIIGDQEKAYRTAQADTPLQIPSNLSHTQIGSDTEKLPANIPAGSLEDTPMPPGSLTEQIATGKVSKSVLKVKLPDPK